MNPQFRNPHAEIKRITGKHHGGWSWKRHEEDGAGYHARPIDKGRHIAPVASKIGRHDARRPVTYDAQGTVTPLTPTAHVLDVVA